MAKKLAKSPESFSDTVNRIENATDLDSYTSIKALIEKVEMAYFEIGGHITKMLQGRSQSDMETLPNYEEGMSAKQYAEKEFGYKSPKCRYLAQNYQLMVDLLNEWEDLGGTPLIKVKELLPIAKPDNLADLVALAKNMSALELKAFVAEHLKPVEDDDGRKMVRKIFTLEAGQKVFVDRVLESVKKEAGVSGDSSALEAVLIGYAADSTGQQSLPPLDALLELYPTAQVKKAVSSYVSARVPSAVVNK